MVYCGGVSWDTDLNIMALELQNRSFAKHQWSIVYSFSYINFKPLTQTTGATTGISSHHLYHSSHSDKIDADRKAWLHAYTYLCMHGRGIIQAHTHTQTNCREYTHTHWKKKMNTHSHTHSVIQTLTLGQSATMVLAASEGQAAWIALTKEMHPWSVPYALGLTFISRFSTRSPRAQEI